MLAGPAAVAGHRAEGHSVAYTWHNVTVGGGGFAPAIIFSRAERDLVYLRTDIGGIYRWDQRGDSWLPLQDNFSEGSYLGVESIALDRHDPDVVYAAVGMYHRSPAAIIRSTNRGQTWTVYPVGFGMGGNEAGRGVGERLSIDPNAANIVYFGSRYDGLQRSLDSGRSWQRVASFPDAGVNASGRGATRTGLSFVVFDPRSGHPRSRSIFVGVADLGAHHLFHSDDAGATWVWVPNEPRSDLLPVQAQMDERGKLYITYSNSTGPSGASEGAVYTLDTQTYGWTDITPDRSVPTGYMGLSIDRGQPNTVVVATLNRGASGDVLWRSMDGGRSWRNLREISVRDVSIAPFLTWGNSQAAFGWWMAGVAIDPFDSNHIVYTTGATVYATDHLELGGSMPGILWRPWVKGIEETAVITLASPTVGPHLYSGFGDIGGFAHEDLDVSPPMFGRPTFNNTNSVDYAGRNPSVVVRSGMPALAAVDNSSSLAWSENYGKSWQPLTVPTLQGQSGGNPQQHGPGFNGEIPIITSADGTVFIVMAPVPLRSQDRGKTWTLLGSLPPMARVIADREDPRRLYAVDFAEPGFFASQDSGVTFQRVASTGLPHTLRADEPGNPEMAVPLLAVPGRSGDLWLLSQGRLFHSLDGGRSFQAVTNELSVVHLGFGKAAEGHDYPSLYAIGSRDALLAIWRSDDRGKSWVRINDAQHEYGRRFRCIAGDMRVYGRVYVGTDGRGIVYGEPGDG